MAISKENQYFELGTERVKNDILVLKYLTDVN